MRIVHLTYSLVKAGDDVDRGFAADAGVVEVPELSRRQGRRQLTRSSGAQNV